jgi:hypothetical protein
MEMAEHGKNLQRILLRRKDLIEGNILKTLYLKKVNFPYRLFGRSDARVWMPSLETQSPIHVRTLATDG